jgi:hypothetical protein
MRIFESEEIAVSSYARHGKRAVNALHACADG